MIARWIAPVALSLMMSAAPARAGEDAGHRVEQLSPGHAVLLGNARVEGEFNDTARRHGLHRTGPRSRDYSVRMVWAPERATALFTGANHATPHRLNDVWEFDLRAMAWRLLYAPDNSRSYLGMGDDASDVRYRDGVLITERGGPAVVGHTWSGLTYDPVRRRLLFMSPWATKQDEVIRELGGDPGERYKGPPLWSFDPAGRKWALVRTPRPWPRVPPGALLEYVPELEGAIWHMNNWQMRQTWLYRPGDGAWRDLEASGAGGDFAGQAPSRELVGYYDPGRRIVVAHWQRSTFHFDPRERRWTRVFAGDPESDDAPIGHDARATFQHDPASGHGLLVDFRGKAVWAYDPDGPRWTRLAPRGDPMPAGARMLAYVDRRDDVLVVIDDTTVWAYRHGAAKPARGPGS